MGIPGHLLSSRAMFVGGCGWAGGRPLAGGFTGDVLAQQARARGEDSKAARQVQGVQQPLNEYL